MHSDCSLKSITELSISFEIDETSPESIEEVDYDILALRL
jgi:hypothetical protein